MPPELPGETAGVREIVFHVSVDEENSAGRPEPPDDPSNLRFPALSSRSREVLETLVRQKGRAAPFYEGALRALGDRANPVGAEMAAYALRELIQELERAVGGPREGPKPQSTDSPSQIGESLPATG